MARTKEQNERMRETTSDKIMSAAVALFATKGLAATSAREIADKAEVAVGLMYHYYKSKEEIFEALVQHGMKEIGELRGKSIQELNDEIEKEMESGIEFSQWISIMPDEYFKQMVAEFGKDFVATLIGKCKLQLILTEGL